MTVGTDFSLPEGDGGPAREGPPPQTPVIVIEYRSRHLAARLMPPALVVLAALAIASYQRKTPVWPLIPRPQPAHNDAPPRPTIAPAGGDGAPALPAPGASEASAARAAVAPGRPDPAPDPSAVATETSRPPSPFDLDSVDGMHPFEPPPVVTAPPPPAASAPAASAPVAVDPRPTSDDPLPGPAPVPVVEDNPVPAVQASAEPSRDEILRDIEREGEQKDARRQDLEGLKQNARSLLLNEAVTRVHAERVAFHDELKQLLFRLKGGAGEEIGRLCERYGKEPIPEVKAAYAKVLRTAPKRLSTEGKVELMRAVGVPEPLILDQLCHDLDKLVNTRGGPRTEDEVRVRAARKLLGLPVAAPGRKPQPPAPGGDRDRPARASAR